MHQTLKLVFLSCRTLDDCDLDALDGKLDAGVDLDKRLCGGPIIMPIQYLRKHGINKERQMSNQITTRVGGLLCQDNSW